MRIKSGEYAHQYQRLEAIEQLVRRNNTRTVVDSPSMWLRVDSYTAKV